MSEWLERDIHEEDVFGSRVTAISPEHFTTRETVRVVPTDSDGQVGIVFEQFRGIYAAPGGTIEAGESQIEALQREVREEIGCILNENTIKEIGRLREIRLDTQEICVSYCYMADTQDEIKKAPRYTLKERLQGCKPIWMEDIAAAINKLKTHKPRVWDYKGHFIYHRDKAILEHVQMLKARTKH